MISTKWSKQFCSEPLENIENYDKAVEWLRERMDIQRRPEET